MTGLEQNGRVLYALFNTLNSADENDTICSTMPVKDAGTNHQVCEPVFIREEVDEEIALSANKETGFFARIRNAYQSREKRVEKVLNQRASDSIELLPEMQSHSSFMRQNDSTYNHSFRASGDNRAASATPWFSALPPGYSQQVIHSGYRDQPQR